MKIKKSKKSAKKEEKEEDVVQSSEETEQTQDQKTPKKRVRQEEDALENNEEEITESKKSKVDVDTKEEKGGNQECRVYAGNLSFHITEDAIKIFFADCGDIVKFDWILDHGKFYGTCFLEFDTLSSAKKAVAMSGKVLLNRPIKLEFPRAKLKTPKAKDERQATEKKARPEGCKTIFMGNLSFTIKDSDIYTLLKDCGTITNLRRVKDKNTGIFKGCLFVEFENEEAADKAMNHDGEIVLGRAIKINY